MGPSSSREPTAKKINNRQTTRCFKSIKVYNQKGQKEIKQEITSTKETMIFFAEAPKIITIKYWSIKPNPDF